MTSPARHLTGHNCSCKSSTRCVCVCVPILCAVIHPASYPGLQGTGPCTAFTASGGSPTAVITPAIAVAGVAGAAPQVSIVSTSVSNAADIVNPASTFDLSLDYTGDLTLVACAACATIYQVRADVSHEYRLLVGLQCRFLFSLFAFFSFAVIFSCVQ